MHASYEYERRFGGPPTEGKINGQKIDRDENPKR